MTVLDILSTGDREERVGVRFRRLLTDHGITQDDAAFIYTLRCELHHAYGIPEAGKIGNRRLFVTPEAGAYAVDSRHADLEFDSFEQARNAGLDFLGEVDPATRQPYIGRLDSAPSTYGKLVGFTTRVNGVFKRFRMDYDPKKGPHINVEVGSGKSGQKWALKWSGTEEDFARLLGGNS